MSGQAKTHRMQFRLVTLLLLITLCAVAFAYWGHVRNQESQRQLREPYGTWVVDIEDTFTATDPESMKAEVSKWQFFVTPGVLPLDWGPLLDDERFPFSVCRLNDPRDGFVYAAVCEATKAVRNEYYIYPRNAWLGDGTIQLRLRDREIHWQGCTSIPQLAGRRVVLRGD